MISGIFSIATAIWFYKTARDVGKNHWVWAALGFIIFQGSFNIFTKLIVLPVSMFTPSVHGNSLLNTFLWTIATLLSIGVIWLIRRNFLMGNFEARDSGDSVS